VIDVFVDELDLGELGFDGVAPEEHGSVLRRYLTNVCQSCASSIADECEGDRDVFHGCAGEIQIVSEI